MKLEVEGADGQTRTLDLNRGDHGPMYVPSTPGYPYNNTLKPATPVPVTPAPAAKSPVDRALLRQAVEK